MREMKKKKQTKNRELKKKKKNLANNSNVLRIKITPNKL